MLPHPQTAENGEGKNERAIGHFSTAGQFRGAGDHGTRRPHIVIIGGGFAGIAAAKALRQCEADVTVIDRRNHHIFQPLLYQVATAVLAPADVAAPIRQMSARQKNVYVLLAEVIGVDMSIPVR